MEYKPKRSLNVQTYVDARLFAGLVQEFELQGIPHKGSYSHVLYEVLKLAVDSWECVSPKTTEEALSFLQSRGFSLGQMKIPQRGKRLLRALNEDAREADTKPAELEGRVEELKEMFGGEEEKT